MCRVATAAFGAELSSARLARHWISDHFVRWELTELTETVTLLTSELVTNAVVHSGSGPAVTVAVAVGLVEVGVSDHDVRRPHPVPPLVADRSLDDEGQTAAATAFAAEGGRGLWLVDTLAYEWGVTSLTAGKQVWLRMEASEWSYRSQCRCEAEAADRVRLESGRYALHQSGPWDLPRRPSVG